ncbi:hypothetical protein ACWGJY_34365, partial [Streptomyces sp. NPDC054765]
MRYEITADGDITRSGAEPLYAGGWLKQGLDFVHDRGGRLRADTGEIDFSAAPIAGDPLAVEPGAPSYRLHVVPPRLMTEGAASGEGGLFLVPVDADTSTPAVRLPWPRGTWTESEGQDVETTTAPTTASTTASTTAPTTGTSSGEAVSRPVPEAAPSLDQLISDALAAEEALGARAASDETAGQAPQTSSFEELIDSALDEENAPAAEASSSEEVGQQPRPSRFTKQLDLEPGSFGLGPTNEGIPAPPVLPEGATTGRRSEWMSRLRRLFRRPKSAHHIPDIPALAYDATPGRAAATLPGPRNSADVTAGHQPVKTAPEAGWKDGSAVERAWTAEDPRATADLEAPPTRQLTTVPVREATSLSVPSPVRESAAPATVEDGDGARDESAPESESESEETSGRTSPPAEQHTEPALDPDPDSDPDSEPESDSDAKSDAESESESDSDADSYAGSDTESDTESDTDDAHTESESDSEPYVTDPDTLSEPDGLYAIVANFGHGHRGLQGSVHVMPFPDEMLEWERARISAAVRAMHQAAEGGSAEDLEAQDQRGSAALEKEVADEYAKDAVLEALPYALSATGMVRIVTYRGRRYQVAWRLDLGDARPAPAMASDVPEGRRVQIEERNKTTVSSSDTSGRQTVRSIPLSYGRTWAMNASGNPVLASLASLGITPKLTLTHNQEATSVTVVKEYMATSALAFAAEPSRVYDYGMASQIKVEPLDGVLPAPAPAPVTAPAPVADEAPVTDEAAEDDGWGDIVPVSAPGRLAAWFPDYLTEDPEPRPFGSLFASAEELPADPQTLAGGVLPMRMDTVRDPAALHDAIVAADELRPHLRRMSPESAEQLGEFLSENNQRSGLPLMLAHAYPSPVLQDRAGDPLGFLEVRARLKWLSPDVLARSKNVVLENSLFYTVGAKSSHTVSNAVKPGFSFAPAFADPGGSGVGGGPAFSAAYQYQRDRAFNSGGTAYDWFGLVSENPHLLTEADIEFEAVLVFAEGGRSDAFTFSRPAGHLLRVPSQAEVDGVPVLPGQERHLPPEMLELRSFEVFATPLEVTGTEEQFEELATQLRTVGLLPPAERRSLSWMDEVSRKKTLQAWAANQRKLSLARSQIGLRSASRDMISAGSTIHLDLPFEYDSWRACAVVRAKPQEDTYPLHRRNFPNWSSLNGNGMYTGGGESFTATHTLSGEFSGEAHGPVSDDTTMKGGTPSSASVSGQRGNTAGSSSGLGLDMLAYAQPGLAQFDIPVTHSAELYFGQGTEPVWTSAPRNGNLAVTLPLARTLAERPAPLPAPTSRPATDEDYRLARMQPDEQGNRPQEALLLPADAHINVAFGSAELFTAFQQLLAGGHLEGSPEPGALARILNWTAEHGSQVGRMLPSFVTQPAQWLKDVTLGESLTSPESSAQEAVRAALSSTVVHARSHQILRGVYVFDAGSAGSLLGTDVQGEVRGFLHENVVYQGIGSPPGEDWMESDVTAADSAWRGKRGKRTVQLGFSGSGTTRTSGDTSRTVTGSAGQSFSVSWSETDTDAVFNIRMNVDAREPLHEFRADITYVFALAQGYRNAPANAVGLGPRGDRTLAVRVPGAAVFWVSETDVRENPRLAALAGLPYAVPKLDRLLPPSFVRSNGRALGPATVPEALPDGPLDAFVEALRAEVTREAPGSLTPGSSTYVPGLDSRIAEVGSATGLRALPGTGAEKWQRPIVFVYKGWDGLHLVTVAVNARPAPDLELGEVRGALRPKSGVENIYSSAPSSVTRGAARSGTFTLGLNPSGGFAVATGTDNTGSAGASASFSSNSSHSTSLTLSHNRQQWLRTYAPSAQFKVRYEYRAVASSERLPDTVPGFLINQVVSLGQLAELLAAGAL